MKKSIIKLENDRIKRYIDRKLKKVKIGNFREYKVAYVFAEEHVNDLAYAIYTAYDIDYVAIFNGVDNVSLRTNKDNVDVSEIAGLFGGGGHPKASGFEIPEDIKQRFFGRFFS